MEDLNKLFETIKNWRFEIFWKIVESQSNVYPYASRKLKTPKTINKLIFFNILEKSQWLISLEKSQWLISLEMDRKKQFYRFSKSVIF